MRRVVLEVYLRSPVKGSRHWRRDAIELYADDRARLVSIGSTQVPYELVEQIEPDPTAMHVCPDCGLECESAGGLGGHRWHRHRPREAPTDPRQTVLFGE